ncbi:MAG: TetR family transcriptional regulator [Spirochaetes bacterium]|jgi:AcrR family transcriptional regulator|nr:TetR family transcriptional regulator [Spirochaetota bacterium]
MSQQQLRRDSYHHGNLKQALIQAATEMILESGIASVTMRALARRVGVSPAAYAYHFPDKGSLLIAIATEGFRKLNAHFEPARRVGDPREHLRLLGEQYIDFALTYPGHYRVMFGDHSAIDHSEPDEEFISESGAAFQTLVHAMEHVMDTGPETGRALDGALVVWSQIHGAVLLWNTGMFPPQIEENVERSEEDFRRITGEALGNTVSALAAGS